VRRISAKIKEKRPILIIVAVYMALAGLCGLYIYEVFLGIQKPPFSKPLFLLTSTINTLPLLATVAEEEYSYARLYRLAKKAHPLLSEELKKIEKKIAVLEAEYESYMEKLRAKYGAGYLTEKTVKNNKGKKYKYLVYRTFSKDIYIKDNRIIVIREKLKKLKELRKKLRKNRDWAKALMEALEPYVNAESSSSYTLT